MNNDDNLKDKIYSRFANVSQPPTPSQHQQQQNNINDAGYDSDATAETRSAPGDLAKIPLEDICIPGVSGENDRFVQFIF